MVSNERVTSPDEHEQAAAQTGKPPLNVVVLLGVGEGQAGMAGTDRAPVLLLPERCFVTNGDSPAVVQHAISA